MTDAVVVSGTGSGGTGYAQHAQHAQHGPAGRVRREAGAPGQQLGQLRTGHDQMGAPRPEVMNRRSRSGPPRVQLTPAYEADDREAGVN